MADTDTKEIYSIIPKIMEEIGAIGKDRNNTFQKYSFRGIDDMYNVIQPHLIKYGIFCCPEIVDSHFESYTSPEGRVSFRSLLRVKHRFYAQDRSYIDVVTQGEGLDTSDKASNKAMSAAMKYAFIELFSIPTESVDDSDAESPQVMTKAKPKLVQNNAPEHPAICEHDWRPSQYPGAKEYCAKKCGAKR